MGMETQLMLAKILIQALVAFIENGYFHGALKYIWISVCLQMFRYSDTYFSS